MANAIPAMSEPKAKTDRKPARKNDETVTEEKTSGPKVTELRPGVTITQY